MAGPASSRLEPRTARRARRRPVHHSLSAFAELADSVIADAREVLAEAAPHAAHDDPDRAR